MTHPDIENNPTHFPDWAPPNTVSMSNVRTGEKDTYLIRRAELATVAASDPRMEKVWASYRNRAGEGRKSDGDDFKWHLTQWSLLPVVPTKYA
jgi:hypothetical protein